VEVAVCGSGAQVIATVHNGGPTIPAADQERIFDRFVRLDDTGTSPGSGLGLFIARSLAESQDGQLTVDSDSDRGTTFTLTLPAAAS